MATLPALFVLATVVLCLPLEANATSGSATATSNLAITLCEDDAIDIQTRWLSNGLRVVTVTGPWSSELVSIRLVLRGGYLTNDETEKLTAHLLEHLVFRRKPDGEGVLEFVDRHGGWTYASVRRDFERYEYDVAASWAEEILQSILFEWERGEFDKQLVDIERRRVLHEDASDKTYAPLSVLGREYRPHGPLNYSKADETTCVDTVSAGTLRKVFHERFTTDRITLLVAGRTDVVRSLESTIDEFGAIPKRTGENKVTTGDVSWLAGSVGTKSFSMADNVIGIHFPNPNGIPFHVRSTIIQGVVTRIREDLDSCDCHSARPDTEICHATDREVWLIHLNPDSDSMYKGEEIQEMIKATLGRLADPSARVWWEHYLATANGETRLAVSSPDRALDAIVENVARSRQTDAVPDWREIRNPLDSNQVIKAYRQIYETGVIFHTYWDQSRYDFSSWDWNDTDVALADCLNTVLLTTDASSVWWVVAFFAFLMTFVAAIRFLAVLVILAVKYSRAAIRAKIPGIREGECHVE